MPYKFKASRKAKDAKQQIAKKKQVKQTICVTHDVPPAPDPHATGVTYDNEALETLVQKLYADRVYIFGFVGNPDGSRTVITTVRNWVDAPEASE